MSKGELAVKQTANLNVRVPAVSYEMLQAISRELGISINAVVNAVFEYALAPKWMQLAWGEGVEAIRQILLGAGLSESIQMSDFTTHEWAAKRQFYDRLQEVGFIEDLSMKKSVNFSDRVLCSFRLTTTARIVAMLLQDLGGFHEFAEQFEQAELPPQEVRLQIGRHGI